MYWASLQGENKEDIEFTLEVENIDWFVVSLPKYRKTIAFVCTYANTFFEHVPRLFAVEIFEEEMFFDRPL